MSFPLQCTWGLARYQEEEEALILAAGQGSFRQAKQLQEQLRTEHS